MAKLGSLNLEKLQHVKRKMKGNDGNMIDVIILPIEANGFYVGEKSTNLNFKIIDKKQEFSNGDSVDGFITHERPIKTILGEHKKWREMDAEEKKKVNDARPILGNFREFEEQKSQSYDDAPELDAEEEDDLPF